MTGLAIVLAVLLAPFLIVLIWIGLQVNKLVRIVGFLSIEWQKQNDLVRDALITHDMPDLPEPSD
jgi:hypothetical protein